jgi:preprotein translocase subunit SecA
MFFSLLEKVIGSKNDRELKRLSLILDEVNDLEPSIMALSDEELKAKTPYFKEKLQMVQRLTTYWLRHLQSPEKQQDAPYL